MASQPLYTPDPPEAGSGTELLDAVRQGNVDALQGLIDRFSGRLLGFASQIVGSDDAAEDAVQCAFIRFWQRRERWRQGSDPKPILYTLVRNLALNHLDSERARARRSADPRIPRRSVATPAQILEERELIRLLERKLEAIPPRRREALILARFHQMTHAEIAQVMGLAKRTVTNHITTALAELEESLAVHLGD